MERELMKKMILKLLKENEDFVSGQMISDKLGVSRTAIWKYINTLKEEGYEIESISRRGYKIVSSPDVLTYEEIEKFLNTKYIGRDLVYLTEVDSTNNYTKNIASNRNEGTVVIAEQQISGKGRLGRQWTSPSHKGVYMSILLKPNLDPTKVAKFTLIGAAAVYQSLNAIGIQSQIKWPNDIVINGKKICGILTEMSCELNIINHIIMGIGINVNLDQDDIPEELKDRATSLKLVTGSPVNRKELLGLVLNHFEKLYESFKNDLNLEETIKICKEHSALIGKEVHIIQGNNIRTGKAIDINNEGELIVEFDTGIETIYSGEISVRGLNGYV